MTKQVQIRRGTDSQHTSFTGAEGEISVNTTNDSVHVHDGTTAGGKEMARADGSNVAFTSGTIDGTVIGGTTPAAGTFTTGDFNTSLNVDGTITGDGLTVDGSSVLSVDSSSIATVLELRNDDKTDDNGLRLDFNSLDTSNNDNIFGRIEVEIKNHATEKSNMNFSIRNDSGDLTELFVLDKDEKVIMNGSVGIGTSSVDTLLHLSKTTGGSVIRLENPDTGLSNGEVVGKIEFETQDAGGAGVNSFIQAVGRGTGGANNLEFATGTAGSPSVAMTIQSDQNIGIGTSSITSLGTGITTLELKGNSASQSDRSGGIRFTRYDGSEGMYIYNADGASYIESRSTYPLLITTNGTERMRIDSSGNVGIGTSSITSGFKMEVTGDARFGDAYNDDAVEVGWSAGGSVGFVQAYDRGASAFRNLQLNNAVTITSGGSVGIGTSNPDNPLHISASVEPYIRIENTDTILSQGQVTGGIIFEQNDSTGGATGITGRIQMRSATRSDIGTYFGTAADMDFLVSGASDGAASDNASKTAMTIRAGTGNIGIGETSPNSALHIANKNSSGSSSTPNFRAYAVDGDSYFEINNSGNNSILQRIYRSDTTLVYTFDAHSGNLTITGALSKGSGSFKIDHPLPAKTDTHDLVHSFVEAPQADNIYRGVVDLVNGSATVNIDTVAGMTDGTFAALNREVQCFTSNESGWTAIKGSVSGNILTITAQDNACTDTVSWLVVGERKDQHMYDTDWTDDNGKVIVEPLKST